MIKYISDLNFNHIQLLFQSPMSAMLRVNVQNNADDYSVLNDMYFGFLGFSRKKCGVDFISTLADGSMKFEIFDFGAYYQINDYYTVWNGAQTASWIQFSKSVPNDGERDLPLNNPKKDQFYLTISGLDKIDFGAKDMTTCLESVYIGAAEKTEENLDLKYAKCAAEDKILGW